MINFSDNLSFSRQVVFITHPSIQSKAFATYLTDTLSVMVTLHNINKPLTQHLPKESVILFDIAVSNKKLNGVWRDVIQSYAENPRLLIINSAQNMSFMKWRSGLRCMAFSAMTMMNRA